MKKILVRIKGWYRTLVPLISRRIRRGQPTTKQQQMRHRFRKAVAYAVSRTEAEREHFARLALQRKLPNGYIAAIQDYLSKNRPG